MVALQHYIYKLKLCLGRMETRGKDEKLTTIYDEDVELVTPRVDGSETRLVKQSSGITVV